MRIAVSGLMTEFGKLSLAIVPENDFCSCTFSIERSGAKVIIRLPDYLERKAVSCTGGIDDPTTESVSVSTVQQNVTVYFK